MNLYLKLIISFFLFFLSCSKKTEPSKIIALETIQLDKSISFIKILNSNLKLSDTLKNGTKLQLELIYNISSDEYHMDKKYTIDAIIKTKQYTWEGLETQSDTFPRNITNPYDTIKINYNFLKFDLDTIHRPIKIELRLNNFSENTHEIAIKNLTFEN